MYRLTRISVVVVAALLVALGVAACGGSDPSEVVARVGATPITRATVSHWMSTMAGGDYYEITNKQVIPAGLVSDPPDYSGCVSGLEGAVAGASSSSKVSGTELLSTCQQLYQAMKSQATAFLVQAQWTIASDREFGITANNAEVNALFKEIRAREYPSNAELQHYLTTRRLKLPDLLFVVRLDLLGQKALRKLKAGGQQAQVQLNESWARWSQKTNCEKGYVVERCKQYKGGPTYPSSPSPAIMMERIAAFVGQ